MKNVFNKILRTVIISTIILFISVVITVLLNIMEQFFPILPLIIGVATLLWAGYLFGNKFK